VGACKQLLDSAGQRTSSDKSLQEDRVLAASVGTREGSGWLAA